VVEIIRASGSQFDPAVVAAFRTLAEDGVLETLVPRIPSSALLADPDRFVAT
jgi:HD-GYP domain-containing protein (c-di-GMP phosphodiesterase class II)